MLHYQVEHLEKKERFGLIFSSMEAKNIFTGCQKVKFDNLAVTTLIQFFIPHMSTDISQV